MRALFSAAVCGGLILCAGSALHGASWIERNAEFQQGNLRNCVIGIDGDIAPDSQTAQPGEGGVFTSRILDASEIKTLRLVTWIETETEKGSLTVELKAASSLEELADSASQWVPVQNPQTDGLPTARYFQYRVTFPAGDQRPSLKEILLSTQTLQDKLGGQERPKIEDLTMSMMYQATGEKLSSFYQSLPYNASERGMYILRNAPDEKVVKGSYLYRPSERETFLPAKFGTWIVMRIHPLATFSDLSLKPAPVIMRAKDGREIEGPFDQHRAINFFDQPFMEEYVSGIQAAVEYYRDNNPFVIGYTIMPPEHFYDAQPWPQMTFLGGFGSYAKENYLGFMKKIGLPAADWPAVSNGDISLNAENYLWAYWRNWAGGEYIHRISNAIRQVDPSAQIGTMTYVGDQWLRGLEPAFSEANDDLTFYYSSGLFPRIPGEDGLTGGTVLTYTRPQVLGQSKKKNLVEFDLSSPYVDMKRALAYASYSWAQGIMPVPIVLYGTYPKSTPPLNHLTKYTGIAGENGTPALFRKLAEFTNETRPLLNNRVKSQTAVVLPTFSLYSILSKGGWKPHRYLQLQLNLLKPLFELGVSFDILTEGYLTRETLDRYDLVIIQSPAVYPWMKDALAATRANILALGWAGTVYPPGPHRIDLTINPEDFSKKLSHSWPVESEQSEPALLSGSGKIVEETTEFVFRESDHNLLKGLGGKTVKYSGMGLNGRDLPYVGGGEGETLATDSQGRPVLTEQTINERKIIRFGGLFWYRSQDGKETSLLNEADLKRLLMNVFDECKVEYFRDLGHLRVLRLSKGILIENSGAEEYSGPFPLPTNYMGDLASLPPNITIPAYGVKVVSEEPKKHE